MSAAEIEFRRLLINHMFKALCQTMEVLGAHPLLLVTCLHVQDGDGQAQVVIDFEHEDTTALKIRQAVHDQLVRDGCRPDEEGETIQ